MQAPAEKKYERIIREVQKKLIGGEGFKGCLKLGRDYRVICNSHRKRTINGCQIFSVQIFARVIQLLVHKHTQDTDPPSRNPRFTLHAAC